ncbi:MAG: N4-gp56 family major capsid protein, partial [Clostridiales bacterium]|nr:N4-gp56 family major capsid protein [Clostridiales bacterium]
NAGTNVVYAGGTVKARANLTSDMKLKMSDIYNAARILKTFNAKRIDGSYIAIIHPNVSFDLMTSEDWIDVNKYSNAVSIFEGEIGKLGGVRFIESTEAKVFKKAGSGGVDVYSTLVVGENAYGVTSVEGGGLEHIVKQNGSSGTADPLNQRSTVGWKSSKTAEILVQEYMVRIESGATHEAEIN